MAFWSWYLLAVAALGFAGYLLPSLGWTATLAAGMHLAFHAFPSRRRALHLLKAALATAAALALAWRESFLPPVSTLSSFLVNPRTRPTVGYLAEFLWQAVNLRMLATGAALLGVTRFFSRRAPLMLGLAAYGAFAASWLAGGKAALPDIDVAQEPSGGNGARVDRSSGPAAGVVRSAASVAASDAFYRRRAEVAEPQAGPAGEADPNSPADFYRRERDRIAIFPRPAEGSAPFDVLILHVCSLSWKDIRDAGADVARFFARSDYVFTNFNSACSYSGPAALRLLRAPCGQEPHRRLYFEAPAGCYLMDVLRAGGFKTFTMFSHDGTFDNFAAETQRHGHADPPLPIAGLPAAYLMFDGHPMVADDAAFHRFWQARQASGAPRAALYYNTANLHAGTHKAGAAAGPDNAAKYKQRLETLLGQLEKALGEVEASGRNAVVIVVPEHGAALTGNPMQAKDIRDIPLPPIATVPVAVRVIGKTLRARAPTPTVVTKPASLLALAWLIAEWVRHDPFGPDARSPEAIATDIPATEFMAEDENAAVMRLGGGFIYRMKDGDWKPLPEFALTPAGTIPAPEEFRRSVQPASP